MGSLGPLVGLWGKSEPDEFGRCVGWLPLLQHLDDAEGVAGRLVDEWVSPLALSCVANDLQGGVIEVRQLACWLAAVHDCGKCSPAFAVQVRELAEYLRGFGLSVSQRLAGDPQRSAVKHALVGHRAVRAWLKTQFGFAPRGIGGQLASIVGSHHGATPDDFALSVVGMRPDLGGDGDWATTREAVLARATERNGGATAFARLATVRLSMASQVLLTGIVIVADWIASNRDLFPLLPAPSPHAPGVEQDDLVTAQRVERGWRQLQLPARWTAAPLDDDLDAVFQSRFGRVGARARPVQVAAVAAARTQAAPGLVIVEAPMGSGKTEAGLLAAEELAARSGASGVFVALPTQATTDAMFSRVRAWLDRVPRDGAVTLNLVHGKAHLNDDFRGLVPEWKATSIGQDDDPWCQATIAHSWLRGRKKAALASFVVGTIDQILLCGLKSRHLMLRHLAVAGKVVIIDEVHAYDVYMSQYLDRVLQWLGAYGVPVVLLSATLPDRRRAELLRAYDPTAAITDEHPGYPVISSSGGVATTTLALPDEATAVTVDRLPDDLDTLVGYLRTHLVEGGCAAVVRNTVTRVQDTADRLIEEFGPDAVTVTHSRFLACERSSLDRSLLARFGPDGSRRPRLHIVVASQVIEQSLDVDFDLMVTDLAPVDLVLQRLGRLHRHPRRRPGPVGAARCALVGVEDWTAEPVTAPRAARRIYGEHQLLRAAALLRDRNTIALPHDIAGLVQAAYGADRLGPDSWQPAMAAAAATAERLAVERATKAGNYLIGEPGKAGSLVGWLHANVGEADETARGTAQVRDGAESLEVLVVQRDRDGGLLTPTWIPGGGEQIPLDDEVPWRLARTIAACSLRLPLAFSHDGVIDTVIKELETANRFTSFDRTRTLAGQLVLSLDDHRQAVLNGYQLTYDLTRGLLHERL